MGLWLLTYAASKAIWVGGLALLALAVQRSLRKPAVSHFAWLVVLASLFMPALVTVPLPVLSATAEAVADSETGDDGSVLTPARQVPSPLESASGHESAAGGSLVANRAFPTDGALSVQSVSDRLSGQATAGWRLGPGGWVSLIWVTGSLVWLTITVIPLVRFRRQVRRVGLYDEAASHRARALGADWGLKSVPPVYRVPGCVSPLICGVGSDTRILFPDQLWDRLSDVGRDALLLHELAHYRRGDHWVRLLEYVACGVFWWHPAVWLARHYIEQAEEQCCDAWVAERFEGPARPYAEALLAAVDYVSNPQPVLPPLSSGIGDVPFLKLRLTQIMQRTVDKSVPAAMGRYATAAAIVGILAQPVFRLTTVSAAPSTEENRVEEPLVTERVPTDPPAPQPAVARGTASRKSVALPSGGDEWWQAGPPPVWAESMSPDGKYRLTAKSGFGVQLTVLGPSLSQQAPIDLSSEEITCAQFLERSDRFVAGSRDGRLRLWDATTGLPISLVGSHRGDVRALVLTADEKQVVSAGGDGVVMLWDLETGALEAEWTANSTATTQVGQVRISADGRSLAVTLGRWSDPESVEVAILSLPLLTTDQVFQPAGPVAVVEFSDDGNELLTIEWNGQAKFWSRETGKIVAIGAIDKDRVAEATFSPLTRLWSFVARRSPPLVIPVATPDPFRG